MSRNRRKISIIIPAAGPGRRMKSYGPKPLIDLGNRTTVVGRQQTILRQEFPLSEIIVVVGHEADVVMRHLHAGVKPVENENFETTNVVRSIGMGMRLASYNDVLIVYGDLVFNKEAVRIVGGPSVVTVDNSHRIDDEEVGLTVVDGRVTQFAYDLETKWAQIAYLTGRETEIFRKAVWDRDHSRWFGFEALNKVVEKGGTIRAVEPRGMKVAEIDSSKDIDRAKMVVV